MARKRSPYVPQFGFIPCPKCKVVALSPWGCPKCDAEPEIKAVVIPFPVRENP